MLQSGILNAECRMTNAEWVYFCIRHSTFVIQVVPRPIRRESWLTSRRGLLIGILIVSPLFVAPGLTRPQQSATGTSPSPVATAHPPVPGTLDEFWFAPSGANTNRAIAARFAGLQEGVRLSLEGDHEGAVRLVADPAWQSTELAGYASYYTGLAQLRLKRFDDTWRTMTALVAAAPQGYLAEGAALAAAEAAKELDQDDAALKTFEDLAARKTVATVEILYGLAQAALATGARAKAAEALLKIYYEFPLSDQARLSGTDLKSLREETGAPGTRASFARDLDRAQRVFTAGRYEEARSAFLDLRALAPGTERALIDLRLAACEYNLRRYRTSRDRLRPYLNRASPDQAEVRFYDLSALLRLGRTRDFVTRARALADRFPTSPWAEAALDALATHYIAEDRDDRAAEVFRELYAKFPAGRRAERAAWKAGWWAYRHGGFADAARVFEAAAVTFPRSDYRPSYLYWSGRARARMGAEALARARLGLTVTDYGSSYYGRLAARELEKLGGPADGAASRQPSAPNGQVGSPPTAALIRLLVALEWYDAAVDELEYARETWGGSPALDATMALVLNRQGDYRRASLLIKRAYPQFLTAGYGALPDEALKIVFPLDYWPLIQKYAAHHGLDAHLVAALVAQESMFDAGVRSAANAYGLMQLVPATGRRLGRAAGLGRRITTRSLTDPETNVRLGTKHLADLMKRFREPHLALAAYNAGEHRVVRWLKEKPDLPQDEFIDDIPFPETQTYVRRILGTAEDYRRLYSRGVSQ